MTDYKDFHIRLKKEDIEKIEKVEEMYWQHLGQEGEPFRFRANTVRFVFDLAKRYLEKKSS